MLDCLSVSLIMGELIPERRLFQGHRIIDDMALELPFRLLLFIGEIRKLSLPVEGLLLYGVCQSEQPFFMCAPIEPVDAQNEIGTAQLCPGSQGCML